MERITPKQITSPEDFLIGKTVVATGKCPGNGIEHEDLVSFVFSDNTYCILRYTALNGLIFSQADDIVADVEEWAKKLIEFFRNQWRNEQDVNPEKKVFPRDMVRTGEVHPFEKLRYARRINLLKLITAETVAYYETLAEIATLKDSIKQYEDHYKPEYEKNILRLSQLTKPT